MSDVALAYEALNKQSQHEVEQLVFQLMAKQDASAESKRSHSENLSLVKSFVGKTHAWKDMDVLEYQRQLRGEYRENV